MYLALQNMEVASGRQVRPGDAVPEATTWPNLRSWINRGFVAFVTDGQEDAFRDALRRDAPGEAQQYAPQSNPNHIMGAARRLQLGAGEKQPNPSPDAAPAPAAHHATPFNRAVSGKRPKDG